MSLRFRSIVMVLICWNLFYLSIASAASGLGDIELTTISQDIRPEEKWITVFDWDDTLMPTSAFEDLVKRAQSMDSYDQNMVNPSFECFEQLSNAVMKLIKFALEKGDVYIITNAVEGWVENSCNTCYSAELSEIIAQKVKVIAARKSVKDEDQPSGNPEDWKKEIFKNVIKLPSGGGVQLLSFGDQLGDRMAAHYLGGSEESIESVKTVKFYEKPSFNELLSQLMFLNTDEQQGIRALYKDKLTVNINLRKQELSI